MIKPIGENIIIKPTNPELKTESGFVLPEAQQGKTLLTGVVEGIGSKCDSEIKVGNKVAYAQFSGYEIGGMLLINQSDILGIIDEN